MVLDLLCYNSLSDFWIVKDENESIYAWVTFLSATFNRVLLSIHFYFISFLTSWIALSTVEISTQDFAAIDLTIYPMNSLSMNIWYFWFLCDCENVSFHVFCAFIVFLSGAWLKNELCKFSIIVLLSSSTRLRFNTMAL